MTNEEIIEKIRTTLAEEFEVGIDVIQPNLSATVKKRM